jgi:hypothetical protein
MIHGYAFGIYDQQGGPRGADKTFMSSMAMGLAERPLAGGTFGLRGMASLDPAMGARGYPLLLQTGETADDRTPLVDRQHPHDLIMELATTYSRPIGEGSAFGYFGLPGEPALGPPAFMHRYSSMDNPVAPIGHHWLDSTHVSYGVATAGGTWRGWKLEGSTFKGREPDEHRWDIEKPAFDSYSARLSFNPSRDWALQASYGAIKSPEQLEPDVNTRRFTASASWNWRSGPALGQATFAYGQNRSRPGRVLDAYLLEAAARISGSSTLFGRAERVEKDELLGNQGGVFTASKATLGYLYDFARWRSSQWGLGAAGSLDFLPAGLRASYGWLPASFMLFARVKLS